MDKIEVNLLATNKNKYVAPQLLLNKVSEVVFGVGGHLADGLGNCCLVS